MSATRDGRSASMSKPDIRHVIDDDGRDNVPIAQSAGTEMPTDDQMATGEQCMDNVGVASASTCTHMPIFCNTSAEVRRNYVAVAQASGVQTPRNIRWNFVAPFLEDNREAPSTSSSVHSLSHRRSETYMGCLPVPQRCAAPCPMEYQERTIAQAFRTMDPVVFTTRAANPQVMYPHRAPSIRYWPVLPAPRQTYPQVEASRKSKSGKHLPDCKVCGDRSVGCHYGVYVCAACKVRRCSVCRIAVSFFIFLEYLQLHV